MNADEHGLNELSRIFNICIYPRLSVSICG